MARGMGDDATRREVAINEVLTYLLGEIARHESFGDYAGAHRATKTLSKYLSYLRDKQYYEDIAEIEKIERPIKTSAIEQKRADEEYNLVVMDLTQEALINLAFRSGKLGNKVLPKTSTGYEEGIE